MARPNYTWLDAQGWIYCYFCGTHMQIHTRLLDTFDTATGKRQTITTKYCPACAPEHGPQGEEAPTT